MNKESLLNNLELLKTPILFLVFNRPDTTSKVFDAIRQSRPVRLYIAADGSRTGKEYEDIRVQQVRAIATNVDWDCEVHTLFRDQNLGCKKAVSSAINWFFKHEEEGIILEDDCLPDKSFFSFCQELLEKYRDDTRMMAISGDNFQQGHNRTNYSYYFSRYPHCWGWATWKRAWQHYDETLSDWPEIKVKCLLDDIAGSNKAFLAYWGKIFDKCYAGGIDSWAYPWTYSCWLQSGVTALPDVNLVSNIGFGKEATHTNNENDNVASLNACNIEFPLSHPAYVIRNTIADLYTDTNHFGIAPPAESILCKFVKKLQRKVCP